MKATRKLLPVFRPGDHRSIGLHGETVYLRAPRGRDWRDWSELRRESREFLVAWEPVWPYDALSRRSYRRRLRLYNHEWRAGTGAAFFIYRSGDDRLLGGITLSNIRRGVAQTASLGYWIGQPFARQGYMSEALLLVVGFVFDRLGLNRLEAACLPENEASRKLLSKLGFKEEGVARQYLRINGEWRDHAIFALLRADRGQTGSD